jgi:hypothetical protein
VSKSEGAPSGKRLWARAAELHLSALNAEAAQLKTALDSLARSPEGSIVDRSNYLLDKYQEFSNWLVESAPPLGTEDAVAELSSVAGVYRLAAIGFRRLLVAGKGTSPNLLKSCNALLEQGSIHSNKFHSLTN